MTIEQLTSFFGWWTTVSFAFYLLTVVCIMLWKDKFSNMHARMFGVSSNDIKLRYFDYIGRFKTLFVLFIFTPFLTLWLFF